MFYKVFNILQISVICLLLTGITSSLYSDDLDVIAGTIYYEYNPGATRNVYIQDYNPPETCHAHLSISKGVELRSFLRVAVVHGYVSVSVSAKEKTSKDEISKGKHTRFVQAIGDLEIDTKAKDNVSYRGKTYRSYSADADAYFTADYDKVSLFGRCTIDNQDGTANCCADW